MGGKGEPLSEVAVQQLESAMGRPLRRGRMKRLVRELQASGLDHLRSAPEDELLGVRAVWPAARDAAAASLGVSEPGFAAWRDLAAFEVDLFWQLVAINRLPAEIVERMARAAASPQSETIGANN